MLITYTLGQSALIKELATELPALVRAFLDTMVSLAKELFAPTIAMTAELAGRKSTLPLKLVAHTLLLGTR